MNENLEALKSLLRSGEFHHATYRNFGTLWEGLWFYRKDTDGFRGFSPAGCINKRTDADVLDEAHELVKGTGISIGAYGQG